MFFFLSQILKNIHTVYFSVNELLKTKEDLTKERDFQLQEIVKLREQLAQTYAQQQKLDSERTKTDDKIAEVFHLYRTRTIFLFF